MPLSSSEILEEAFSGLQEILSDLDKALTEGLPLYNLWPAAKVAIEFLSKFVSEPGRVELADLALRVAQHSTGVTAVEAYGLALNLTRC